LILQKKKKKSIVYITKEFMPRYTHISMASPYKKPPAGWKRRGGRRRGGSFKSFLSGANNFLKKSGLLSALGQIGSQMAPGKYGKMAGVLGNAAGAMGYGRRRRRCCGGALGLAGGNYHWNYANVKNRRSKDAARRIHSRAISKK
jgi:hypothetical protein